MTFAADFRERVTPRLARAARLHGLFVACRLESFPEAVAAVWREGARFGAGHLPGGLLDDLVDWIATQILREAVAAEERYPRLAALHD